MRNAKPVVPYLELLLWLFGGAVAGVSVSSDELDPAGDSNINSSMSTYKKKKTSAIPGSSGSPLDGDGLAIGAPRTADGTRKEE